MLQHKKEISVVEKVFSKMKNISINHRIFGGEKKVLKKQSLLLASQEARISCLPCRQFK